MNADAAAWLAYARENAAAARLMAEAGLLNPSLQNSQQAVENAFDAVRLQHGLGVRPYRRQACPKKSAGCHICESGTLSAIIAFSGAPL